MMNISNALNSYSSVISATQLADMKSALQIQEQAVELGKNANTDTSVPVSTTIGTKIDVSI